MKTHIALTKKKKNFIKNNLTQEERDAYNSPESKRTFEGRNYTLPKSSHDAPRRDPVI